MADIGRVRRSPLGPYPEAVGYATACDADNADPLADFRSRFHIADPDLLYLDGNSLGRMPTATVDRMREVVDTEWGEHLIASWQTSWWDLASSIGAQIAPLIGAPPDSVVVADSTSVGLYKLALAALRARPGRHRIVTDDMNFPTDLYVLAAVAETIPDTEIVVVPSQDGVHGPHEGLLAALDDDTALLTLSHVAFKSGYSYDMGELTRAAHCAGALTLWDVSHSVGVVPMKLHRADLAVGCTYKYLNGGPGSPAFLYVNPDLQLDNPLSGWWGHAAPFDFELDYRPADSITRFQTGTMPILSLAALEPAVRLTAEAGIPAIRAKSVGLTEFLIELVDEVLTTHGFEVASPRNPERRGSHVSLRHRQAWQVTQAMIAEAKVVPDFREPDNIRLGLAPLYTSFVDVHTAVHRIAQLVLSEAPQRYPADRGGVT